mmetsp:Transcript_37616/g.61841  ORF Transcript_37616/g.61841 Transcript_37616/m.61841 type:complete len:121 (+) Transcript_37616:1-363(+)
MHTMPKLIVCQKHEFDDAGAMRKSATSMVDEQDLHDEHLDEHLYDLMGVVESNDAQFIASFVKELGDDCQAGKYSTLLALIKLVGKKCKNRVDLHRFDPYLLDYKFDAFSNSSKNLKFVE